MAHAIFDRSLYKQNLARFYHKIERNDFLLQLSDELIQEIIDDVGIKFANTLLYSPPGVSDIKLPTKLTYAGLLPTAQNVYDEEEMELSLNSYDLIISSLSLHLINDLPHALHKYYQALKPKGLFIATLLGGQSLIQLRNVCMEVDEAVYGRVFPRVMPCVDKAAAPGLLQAAGFAIPATSSELISVHYRQVMDLLSDLRKIGHSNCMVDRKKSLEKTEYFPQLIQVYEQLFGCSNGLKSDFEILILMGSKN